MSPAPAAEAATALADAQSEASPAIEPSPIPGAALAKNKAAAPAIAGMEATAPKPEEAAASAAVKESTSRAPQTFAAGSPAKPEEIPTSALPTFSPVVETPVAGANAPASAAIAKDQPAVAQQAKAPEKAPAKEAAPVSVAKAPPAAAPQASAPATVLAPARVGEVSGKKFDTQSLLVGALVLAGLGLLAWVIVPEVRRRGIHLPNFRRSTPISGPQVEGMGLAAAPATKQAVKVMPRLTGGPRQISLKLKASEPSLRRAVVPVSKPGRIFGNGCAIAEPVHSNGERYATPEPAEEAFESVGPIMEGVGQVFEQGAIPAGRVAEPEWVSQPVEIPTFEIPKSVVTEPEPMVAEPEPIFREVEPVVEESEAITPPEPIFAEMLQPEAVIEPEPVAAPQPEPVFSQMAAVTEPEIEPVGQGQPIPQLTPVDQPSIIEITEPEPAVVAALRQPSEPQISPVIESPIYEPTTPVIMPEPIQIPTAPARGGAPSPAGAMQTAVQLTFAFEIASMQLTPTFKMGALQLRPASKVVTMRLAGSSPQPAMNLQVTFEIARIQPAGGTLGSVRLTPSQQQRPSVVGSPSFTVGGLHLVSDFAAAPLQLTPSQQGQAAVHVVAPFQIATVEFSPSFEISSIVLNSNSKQVSVQLPSAGGAAIEGSPVFEISNLQLTGSGEIGMMQLNLLGHGPKRAA